ncbi:LRR receptor-like kinase family protein [Medicago truncatula]|uniref:LRR receptor-like kinase family protein n=1 Tax=Medicago truncatula TaxID=3880 RepID=A0A072TR66_MEDTR|nr:LRR receptor-like kinase family protein [Medicago truncatula]
MGVLKAVLYLKYLDLSGNHIPNLPKSIGNISSEYIRAESCGIGGYIPQEVGNMTNLLTFSLFGNNITGPIPRSVKGLQKLQGLSLGYNELQGSFIEEFCEMKSLGELYLENNKLSGVLPTCLGNMTSLRKLYIGSNNFNSMIPSSLWSLIDILMVDLSSNAFIGDLPLEIGNLRELVILDLSRNQISSNIPTTISSLQNLQNLSLAHNKLNGSIPASLNGMLSLISLDLSQNMLTGVIPKSLESLLYLQNINFSYNRLQGEIPNGGHFKNFTAQSFMHNEALCGDPHLQVPTCGKQVKKWSMEKKLILKCILPIVVSSILVVACIILLKHNKRKKNKTSLERGLSTLGAPRRISYYEIVQATNGFNESNFLGRGGFGSVYQGKLLDGEMIAVKVIDLQSEAKSKSFDAECNAMRNLRHRNLVKIISSCSNLDFKSLVMEFIVLCPHSHACRKTFKYVTHPKTTPSQASLTVEFLQNGLPKKMYLVDIVVDIDSTKNLPSTIQSHTCTALESLSFQCDSVCLKAVENRSLSCLVHRLPLPALVSLGCYGVFKNNRNLLEK